MQSLRMKMMITKIIEVHGEDWVALYNAETGDLLAEGHSISTLNLCKLLGIEIERIEKDDDWFLGNITNFNKRNEIRKLEEEYDQAQHNLIEAEKTMAYIEGELSRLRK